MDHCDRCFLCLDREDTGQIPIASLVDLLFESGVVDDEVPREEIEASFAECGAEGERLYRFQFYTWAGIAFSEEDDEGFEAAMEEIIAACSTSHY